MHSKHRLTDINGEAPSSALRVEGLENRNLLAADTNDSIIESQDMGQITEQPATIAAEISEATDVDMYRVNLNGGQSVDVDVDTPTNGSGLGGYLRVFNDQGVEIASNNDGTAPDDTSSGFDPYLRFVAPQNGQYFIAVSNWQNISFDAITGDGDQVGDQFLTGSYNLSVKGLPLSDSDDAIAEAMSLGGAGPVSYSVNGQIDPDVDVDMYSINILNGQTVDFDIDTPQNGPGGLGSYLRLFDVNGREIAANNDAAAPGESLGFDAYLRQTFASGGLFYVAVSNYGNTAFDPITGSGDSASSPNAIGGYQLTISEIVPSQPSQSSDVTNQVVAAPAIPPMQADVLSASATSVQTDSGIAQPLSANLLPVTGATSNSASLATQADVQQNALLANSLLEQVPPVYTMDPSENSLANTGSTQFSVVSGQSDQLTTESTVANDLALTQML